LYEEERFSRQKHSRNAPPFRALDRLLKEAGISIREVDRIVVGLTRPTVGSHGDRKLDSFLGDMIGVYDFYDARLSSLGPRQERLDHYEAHALSVATYFWGRETNLMMLDGWGGDFAGAAMSLSADGELRELWRVPVTHSLGLFYQTVTARLGFQPHADEGKTMGLAAYGEVDEGLLPDLCDAGTSLPELPRYLEYFESCTVSRRRDEPLTRKHENFAATAQFYLERAVVRSAERMWRETGCRSFGVAGGVALNCVANGKLARSDFVDEIIVTPVANDAGTALGAAIAGACADGQRVALPRDSAFFGPGYSEADINAALNFAKLALKRCDPAEAVSRALVEGKVAAIYQGRAEIGPRALGARTILADPRSRAMRDRVNNEVKQREAWRPFAPVAREAKAREIFGVATPFMTIADEVNESWRPRLEAVVHVDGTARAQIVPSDSNPLLEDILDRFDVATGVPVLLNTSFNLSDEPIVERPDQAIATFFRSGLDVLAFEHGILTKAK
jgi:carbamoyltransferase